MFAVLLQGAGSGHARLVELGQSAHAAIERPYAPPYPPHFSLGVFEGEGHDAIIAAEAFAKTLVPFDVHVLAIGAFPTPPGVIYAAPATTEALVALHAAFVDAFAAIGDRLHPYYRLGAWVPHATLMMPATPDEQGAALGALAVDWQPFDFRLSHLGVARVPDGHVIATFALGS